MKKFFTVLLTAGLLIGTVNAAETDKTGSAILGISPDTKEITVIALTADNSAIQVEGCTVEELPSGESVQLTATGNRIVLKGAITELYCSENRLTSLDVRGLQALTVLKCAGNDLASLDLQGLTALKELYCSDNKLTSLDVRGLTALEKLECSENRLTSLDVRNLTMLWALFCDRNRLTSLNVQGLTALRYLICVSNQLTVLNLKNLSSLRELWCAGNQLAALDMRGISTLQTLDCSGNRLTSLDVHSFTALLFLNCAENQLSEKAFIRILNALPDRKQKEAGKARIYRERNDVPEKNVTDFTSSAELKTAFEAAKAKNWEFYKRDTNGNDEKI